jgi:hypothetical protein
MTEKKMMNGVDLDRLGATIDQIKETPGLARFIFRAGNQWIDGGHNRTTIKGFYGSMAGTTARRSRAFTARGRKTHHARPPS